MQYYDVDKKFSSRSERNLRLVHDYIAENQCGHRVFQGDFSGFNVMSLLSMLGCDVSYQETSNGKYAPHIEKMHVYENDAASMFALIDALE